MIRYLLNVSYIGTAFRGVTFIEPFYRYRDLRTVQGAIENAVKFYFKQRCEVCCSSRTDARVHALTSTFHVDVNEDIYQKDFLENKKFEMIATLNNNFKYQRAAIRINDIGIVNKNTFMAFRNVESRTYVYRIAITPANKPSAIVLPIEMLDRCFIIESDVFDMEKLKKATDMFTGNHDFRSFMQYSKEEKTKQPCFAQRKMISITINPSKPSVISTNLQNCDEYFKFYVITFTANSYVYRQIRKMVGALCAFAMGRITERDVYELLTIPSISAWNLLSAEKNIEVAPAYGLYFAGINYKSEEEWSLDPHDVRSKSFFQ